MEYRKNNVIVLREPLSSNISIFDVGTRKNYKEDEQKEKKEKSILK